AIADHGVAVGDLRLAFAQGLHFPPLQDQAGLESLYDMVVGERLFVLGDAGMLAALAGIVLAGSHVASVGASAGQYNGESLPWRAARTRPHATGRTADCMKTIQKSVLLWHSAHEMFSL